MIIQTTTKSGNIEKDNLEAHVEICSFRHQIMEKKITEVESKITSMTQHNDAVRSLIIKSIGAATAVVSLVMTAAVTFLTKL